MMEPVLYTAQRITALVLAPLVLIHLGLILYAIGDGLTVEEILSRTRGNLAWAGFYSLFVLSAAVHGPIGLRSILREWFNLRGVSVDASLLGFAVLLAVLGMRAVIAVY